jgi:hypothetical protein
VQVRALVAEKVEKFPSAAAAHLMAGLVAEGQGRSPHDGHAHGWVALLTLSRPALSGLRTTQTVPEQTRAVLCVVGVVVSRGLPLWGRGSPGGRLGNARQLGGPPGGEGSRAWVTGDNREVCVDRMGGEAPVWTLRYYWAEAAESFAMAAELAEHEDWQPRWRLALLQRRMGNYSASNATFAALLTDFTGGWSHTT